MQDEVTTKVVAIAVKGGKITAVIPAELGYGQRNMGKIGPNSVLIFDVDVVKVGKVPATEEESK